MSESEKKTTKESIPEIPRFNWHNIDTEIFRGAGLSFPVSIEIIMAPNYDMSVFYACQDFLKDLAVKWVDDVFNDTTIFVREYVAMKNDTIKLSSSELAMRLTYIDGSKDGLLFQLKVTSQMATRH